MSGMWRGVPGMNCGAPLQDPGVAACRFCGIPGAWGDSSHTWPCLWHRLCVRRPDRNRPVIEGAV